MSTFAFHVIVRHRPIINYVPTEKALTQSDLRSARSAMLREVIHHTVHRSALSVMRRLVIYHTVHRSGLFVMLRRAV